MNRSLDTTLQGMKSLEDLLPDVRDGLTREERVVLYVLHEAQKERGGRNVPTAMLWGRVCEYFYISPEDLSAMLARLGARDSTQREPLSPSQSPRRRYDA